MVTPTSPLTLIFSTGLIHKEWYRGLHTSLGCIETQYEGLFLSMVLCNLKKKYFNHLWSPLLMQCLWSMMNYLTLHSLYQMCFLPTLNHQCQLQQMAPMTIRPGLILPHIQDLCLAFQIKISMSWLSNSTTTFDVQDLVC